jgi:hypothetical protein
VMTPMTSISITSTATSTFNRMGNENLFMILSLRVY